MDDFYIEEHRRVDTEYDVLWQDEWYDDEEGYDIEDEMTPEWSDYV